MLRTFVLAAAAVAVVAPAFADTVSGRIVKIDPDKRLITLNDNTIMVVDPKVDLSTIPTNQPVTLSTKIDENGIAPITAIKPQG